MLSLFCKDYNVHEPMETVIFFIYFVLVRFRVKYLCSYMVAIFNIIACFVFHSNFEFIREYVDRYLYFLFLFADFACITFECH